MKFNYEILTWSLALSSKKRAKKSEYLTQNYEMKPKTLQSSINELKILEKNKLFKEITFFYFHSQNKNLKA